MSFSNRGKYISMETHFMICTLYIIHFQMHFFYHAERMSLSVNFFFLLNISIITL